MIVKDESERLEQFLSHHSPLFDELIIVDTGSTDKTKEIALQFTDKVFDFPWGDDFSAARNFSVLKATGEWILWLDPDEQIEKKDFETIKKMISEATEDVLGFRLIQETFFQDEKIMIRGICKLFRNHRGISFRYPVHESVRESIQEKGGSIVSSGIAIKHRPLLTREKSDHYLRLLDKKKKEFPDSAHEKEKEQELSLQQRLSL
jgi:glycosyltransferase involved in cell wall biosynthesis